MVPEADKPVVVAMSDSDLMIEICTLILHDRLAAENHHAELASLLLLVCRLCEAEEDIVIDIYLHDVVLESWVLTRSPNTTPKKSDHKTMLRSLLGFSPYTAWRRSLSSSKASDTKSILRAISASVSPPTSRRPLPAVFGPPHTCPPFSLPTSSVTLSVHRADRPTLDSISLESLPSEPASLPPGPAIPTEASLTRSLSPPVHPHSKHETVHVHSSGHHHPHPHVHPHHRPSPVSTSPDPRRRSASFAPQLASAPIFIPPPRIGAYPSPLSPPIISPPHGTPRPVVATPALRSRSSSLSRSLSRSPRSCLLGNYEESLLAGSLPAFGAYPVEGFTADLSATGLVSAKRVRLPMAVRYYHIPEQEAPSPYVGTIDLAAGLTDTKGRYRVPGAGVLQVLISNPERTGIKVFMIKYDLRGMPPNSHTFLRQRTFVGQSHGPAGSSSSSKTPQYALHVRFMSSKSGKIFLYKDIRVLFAPRAPDMTEYQHTTTEGPPEPVYAPLDHVLTPRVLFARDTHMASGHHLHSPLAPEHAHDEHGVSAHFHNPHHHHAYEHHSHGLHTHGQQIIDRTHPTDANHLHPGAEADARDSGTGSSPEPASERDNHPLTSSSSSSSLRVATRVAEGLATAVQSGLTLAS